MTDQVVYDVLMQVMKERHRIEKEENVGTEIGWSKNLEAAKKNPELAAINKKFGMVHGSSSLANLLFVGCLAFHSWYLASRMLL